MMNEEKYQETVKSMRNCTTRMDHEGDYWAEDEKGLLKQLFCKGISITEIAIRLQRTEPAIFQQVEKMDLYQRKENPRRRRSVFKDARCLCNSCRLAANFCPHQMDLCDSQEGDAYV